MHSRDMEYIVGLLKNGKDAEAILSVRRKLNMAFLARTTDLSGKLPVLAFGSTFKKNGDGIQLRRYNGYVLLEVNGLESQSEAGETRIRSVRPQISQSSPAESRAREASAVKLPPCRRPCWRSSG